MNVLTITGIFGELNSMLLNHEEVNGMGGEASIVMDLLGTGEAFAPFITVTPGTANRDPRVCIPAEHNVAKVGC